MGKQMEPIRFRHTAQTGRIVTEGPEYNVYCDESCHLENDGHKAMSLGAIWCPKEEVRRVHEELIAIKRTHGIAKTAEIKWTKASPCNVELYIDIVDYFFSNSNLHFRGLVVPDKSILDHERFSQTHDLWYYKMYFTLLKAVFNRDARYYVYIDVKDTHSAENSRKLCEVCANDAYDFSHDIVKRVQPIRSDEVQLMQLVDILTGALAFRHNNRGKTGMSPAKVAIVNEIIDRSGYGLTESTLLREDKFNLLVWQPYGQIMKGDE